MNESNYEYTMSSLLLVSLHPLAQQLHSLQSPPYEHLSMDEIQWWSNSLHVELLLHPYLDQLQPCLTLSFAATLLPRWQVLHLRLVIMATTNLQFNIVRTLLLHSCIGNKDLSCYLPSLSSPMDIPYLSSVLYKKDGPLKTTRTSDYHGIIMLWYSNKRFV